MSKSVTQEKARAVFGGPTRERGKTSTGIAENIDLQAEAAHQSSLAYASGYRCKQADIDRLSGQYEIIMTDSAEFASNSEPLPEPEVTGDGWSGTDIEEAYQKALEAMEDVPWEEGVAAAEMAQMPAADAGTEPAIVETDPAPAASPPADASGNAVEVSQPDSAAAVDSPVEPSQPAPAPVAGPRLARGTARAAAESPEQQLNVSPAQVIEAALFVGGGPLTARKIAGLLRGSQQAKDVEQVIDELNDAYVAQARPYEIRLGDGGYRLELRPEYDRLRHRVYGSGPREVRLSQDVLEVLALVAYRQPITESEIEGNGKQNAGNLLRQLLRRDLIAFQRGPGGRKDLHYHTTARFLSVFGLGTLEELPQAEDLARK
jgi:segregation and condensation protein B